jgi:hypothetical protein
MKLLGDPSLAIPASPVALVRDKDAWSCVMVVDELGALGDRHHGDRKASRGCRAVREDLLRVVRLGQIMQARRHLRGGRFA